MKIDDLGLITCYGQHSTKKGECAACRVKTYCRSAKSVDGQRGYRERTKIEIAAAEEMLATMPDTIETPCGKDLPGWKAMIRILAFLVSLHPTTLEALRHKVQNPEWQRNECAKALGIKTKSITDRLSARPAAAALFYQPEEKMTAINETHHVYLSGPMTGITENNAPAFHQAEEMIAERFRCNIVNPAYTAYLMGDNRSHEHYLTVSLALVDTSDAVVMLPGWRKSVGATMEHQRATEKNIPIFELEELLK